MPAQDQRDERLRAAYGRLSEDERLRSNLTDEEASPLFAWARAQLASAAQPAPDGKAAGQKDELETAFHQVRTTLREINSLAGEKGKLADGQMEQRLVGILSPYATPAGAPSVGFLERIRALVRQRSSLSSAEFAARLSQLLQQVRREQDDKVSLPTPPKKKGVLDLPKALLFALAALLLTGCIGAGGLYWWSSRPTPLPPTPTSVAVVLPTATAAATGAAVKTAAPPTPVRPTAAPTRLPTASAWYQVYFSAPKYPDRPADHVGGLDEKLTAFIASATKSVDVAVLLLDLDNVTRALLDAQKRGCTVRVVTDVDEMNDASFKRLQQAGITVIGGNPDSIMHNKFVVVDGKAVWTGSWNFDVSETFRNNNNSVLIQSAELARNYTAAFEKMWRDRKFGEAKKAGGTTSKLTIGGASVENYFSPEDNIAPKLLARLNAAQSSIDFLAFAFTRDDMGDALIARAKAGVRVRGVIETNDSENEFGEYNRLKAARLDVWQDGNPYLMHHKVFIIDGKTVVTGSYNFSSSANRSNDENMLIIDSAALAGQYTAEFERVYAQAKNQDP